MNVGSFPAGQDRWGVVDLIGNVFEWTSSKASFYPNNTAVGVAQIPENQRDWAVVRGGSFLATSTGSGAVSSTYRDWFDPATKNAYIGFRLVREGPGPAHP
jgi:formylglycine-generating enzyme required for sulfatase activity